MAEEAPTAPFRVEPADYGAAYAQLREVREAVFVREQRVPPALELDAADADCLHVLARDAGDRPIGTGRMSPDGRIGRMAVLPEWRGRGVGTALLQALLRIARERGLREVALNAQAGAIDFYLRHGFLAHGDRFQEAGIDHQAMRLAFARPQAIERREDAVAATVELATRARRRLWIYSRDLDPGLLDDSAVLEALRGFAIRHSGSEARLLLHDASAAQRAHAPLLGLAQRLPSSFRFREVADPVDRGYASAFIANDEGGYYFRSLGNRFDGEYERHGAGRARQLAEAFRPVWERSRPCTELRALGL
ncbi:GNAT family N-acetyltransferase [Luteimonas sp. RD2P54]|uniref:GNAT family N-acetyltransferase n=1 Tax=Luteimonas endophytica TaxID=3042023 RepID=A0ABT6J9B5_9GAMM|nr:GNAT family N-acetyltransferase [Luteimonas endophytica]MDH5823207.1 GNAT family N-acetyltransferase [Luteimonas endophytica]